MNTIHLRALSSSQVTVLSNIFIDQYMPGAGGEFVKVYIYLLRLLADPSASVCLPLLADRLNCTEGDISRALKYWSNEGLLILETDSSGELTGITLTEPSPDTQMELTATVSVPQSALAATAPISQMVSAATVSTPQPDTAPSRSASALTPARIKELKENEDVAQLIYICEQYLGKTLTPTDTRKILFFYDELKMSVDLIDFLIQYCVGRGHKSMRYIETVAMAWSKEGITTVEMAKDSTSRYGRDYFTILKADEIHVCRDPGEGFSSYIRTAANIHRACRTGFLRGRAPEDLASRTGHSHVFSVFCYGKRRSGAYQETCLGFSGNPGI